MSVRFEYFYVGNICVTMYYNLFSINFNKCITTSSHFSLSRWFVLFNVLVANWGLPLAAIADAKDNPEKISGKMTTGKLATYQFHRRWSAKHYL